MNATKLFAVAVLALGTLTLSGAAAKAQWQDIAAANANFDANFDVMARQVAMQYAVTHRGQPCPFSAGHSCTIYERRPKDPCRDFICGWLVRKSPLPEWMRPDQAGMILSPGERSPPLRPTPERG